MTLTVGACTYSWLWDLPLQDAVHRIADMGFRYFELMSAPPHCWPRDWSAAARGAFRKLYQSLGLRLTSVNPTYLDINMASPNPGIRDESIRQLRETIQLAHDIGAGVVVAPGGRKHVLIAPDPATVWGLVQGALESLLPDCERLGVTFGLENGYNVTHTAALMVQMCRELSHPNLKLVYDVANATMVESPLDGLELVLNDMALLHMSDTDDKVWGHDRIGTGVIDFAAVTEKVKKLGYAGPTIMEVVDRRTPDESNRTSLARLQVLGWTT
ncbi:MAG TPA: sugar phosphate isomerase/epimerase family protein [Candidatus Methylomirabilis sp.]|nr:sugar phosphate isomerase/epimerase family protein [Candidatus Methylomirabilis sp.]HSB77547.1 sugar phosphate isomerase/epimerase family protein [Candidatus Methylomirabilis sp.]HSC70678.1 sugar phosphate isomerase/epimerase family protein [Candidatus Methylomirabilis sp.]